MHTTLIETLKQHMALEPGKAELIAKYAQERSYEKGAYLLSAPSISTEIGFVLSGILRYYYIDENGNEVTAMFIQKQDFYTDVESFKKKTPSTGYIQAVVKSKVLVFNSRAHEALLAQIPDWDRTLLRIAQDRLLNQLRFSRSLINNNAPNSYRRFLEIYPAIADKVPNIYIASFLGISKYTFSRIKGKVEKE